MTERAATFFDGPEQFRDWLAAHHGVETELWVGFRKRHTGLPSMTWPESVDQALCYGWIDGLTQRIDGDSHRIRFTPRKPSSIWSAVNLRRFAELEQAGLVQPAGRAAYERRTEARSAVYSYEQPEQQLPAAWEQRLRDDPAAWAYWQARAPSYRRAAVHWVVSAKRADTRQRRMDQLALDCAAGRFIPPFRWAKGADRG